ncbi:hypothetical protein BGZ72_005529 [Mortierella alpina]|nr:hypothetical protein BGZ72_005529 [Mortierella alpina]
MEHLLIQWSEHLRSQFIPVPPEWLRWQAFPIHRMISGCGSGGPLPHHIFSRSWLDRLRNRIPQAWTLADLRQLLQDEQNVVLQKALERLRLMLNEFENRDDDVYFLDETSKFATPPCREGHRGFACQLLSDLKPGDIPECRRGAGISIALMCNVSGTHRPAPVMLITTPDGWLPMSFESWLLAFNNKMGQENRNILLFVAANVWRSIQGKVQFLSLSRIQVVPIPAQLNAWLPTRTGVVREFKLHVEAINFQETFNSGPLSHDGDVYRTAWQQVDVRILQNCFKEFEDAVEEDRKRRDRDETVYAKDGSTPAWARLYGIYQKAQEGNRLSAKTVKHVEGVLGYYRNKDIDIGPSAYLCESLQLSPSDQYVQSFLEAAGLCTRLVNHWWDYVFIRQG